MSEPELLCYIIHLRFAGFQSVMENAIFKEINNYINLKTQARGNQQCKHGSVRHFGVQDIPQRRLKSMEHIPWISFLGTLEPAATNPLPPEYLPLHLVSPHIPQLCRFASQGSYKCSTELV